MRNGLYKVDFQTPIGRGSGVIALQDGRVLGGDSSMYYVGTYTQEGNRFQAQVAIDGHTNVPGMASTLGITKGQLNLSGSLSGDTATLSGSSPQAPGIAFSAALSLLAG